MTPTSPDELDHTLSDYFKGHLPATWPACRATAAVQPAAPTLTRDGLWTSRTALAASVALVLGLGFYFLNDMPSNGTRSSGSGSLLPGATANGAELLKPAAKADDPMKNFPVMP